MHISLVMVSKKEKALKDVKEKVENMLRFKLNNREVVRDYLVSISHMQDTSGNKSELKTNNLKLL